MNKPTETYTSFTEASLVSELELNKQIFYTAIRQAYRYPSLWHSSTSDKCVYPNTSDHRPFKFFTWNYANVLTHPKLALSAIYLLYWQHTAAVMKEAQIPLGDVTLRIEEFDSHESFGSHQELTFYTRLLGSIKEDVFTIDDTIIDGAQAFLLGRTNAVSVVKYNPSCTDYCFKLEVNAHFSTPIVTPDSYRNIGEFLTNEYFSCLSL